ncbi:uncharacterized protein [Ptychodera flava]|uniref:uncharacterized protein n=1 Tax=Ptychodera flava TaxID=63121 RepID=UPI00396A327C
MQKTMEKPTAALLLLTSWDLDTDGKSGQPSRSIVRHVRKQTLQSEQISEIFCTVLDVEVSEDKKQDARSVGVTLIPASRNEWSNPEEDPPSLNWILYHDQYYPTLNDLPKIAHVLGCHQKTMTAAGKIRKRLFPDAKLHEITISKLPSTALFVFKTWETEEESLTSKPTHMIIKEFCEKTPGLDDKSDIFCTILDVKVSEDKLKDAKKVGVTLIPAIRNERLEPHEDPPAIHWLANHEIYYPQLKNLKQIKHVIGCDPITKNAATAIHKSLFRKSEFHLLDLPKPPPGALFIGDGWDENDCGLTGFHRTIIQDFCARKGKAVKAYATVADVTITEKQKEDAENCGVTLIPATRKEHVDPEEDQPKLEWLLYHEIYFQVLKRLENITHVIGYAPKTGRAAADIRKKIFSNAELVLINHAYEDNDCLWEADRVKFREKMLKLAGEADVIFSIGPSMYEYFKNQYRASINGKNLADIPHAEIFPKPRAAFFERDPYLPDDGVGTHCILTYGQISTSEALKSCENLASSIGAVANKRKEMYTKPLEWSLMGIPPLNQTEVTTVLRDSTQSGHIQPKLFDHYSAKTLLTSLHQSHLCLPAPCYKDYGFCGLEAIATGIPTNAFEDSQLGCLITKYFPMHKDCVVGRYPTALLAEQMVKTMSNVELAFKSAKKLKEDFKESPGIDKCCSTFASMLTFKRTSTGSGQSDGHGDTIKPADPHHDTIIQVKVKLIETLNQQHLQKERKNGTDDARRQTVDTAWRKCTDFFEGQVREIASSEVTANRVQKTCNDKFGDGVEVTGMATKSLEISVAIPRLVNLYRMEASCQSESFTEALEPIMITDEMREVAATAGIPLKLIATYDQTTFNEIELFFLNRDGGGIEQADIFDGVIEEVFVAEMTAESQSLPLQEAVKGNLTTDTEQIVTLQSK